MTIREALQQRVPRIRKPQWADPQAYLRLPLLEGGKVGPWAELYDDRTQREVLQVRPGSQRVLIFESMEEGGYEAYTGPVSPYEREGYAAAYTES